jgi:serine/threonine-protein kinase
MTALWQIARQPAPATPSLIRFQVQPAAGTSFDRRAPALAVSPDGNTLAWSACEIATGICSLYVRELDTLEPVPLRQTEGAAAPFFSPDGRWIGFFADGKLKKIAASGGSPVTLADAAIAAGASWSSDGRIVFSGGAASGLSLVGDQGGEVRRLTQPRPDRGEVRHAWPSWLPDGRGILYTIAGAPSPEAPGQLAVLTLPAAASRVLRSGVTRGLAPRGGFLVTSSGGDLQAQRFDDRALAPTGAADSVVEGLATAQGIAQFAIGDGGTLVAVVSPRDSRTLAWSDAADRPLAGLARLDGIVVSPDGRRAAGVSSDGTGSDVWIVDLDRGNATRVTYGGTNVRPVWTNDGRLLYATRTAGPFAVAEASAGGAAPEIRVRSDTHVFPGAAAIDGRLAVVKTLPDGRLALGLVARGSAEIATFNEGPFDQAMPSFSPDGYWLAFASDESGRWEISVRNLRDGRRLAVSTGGGERPTWSEDGHWIYFHDATRVLRAAFDAGQARVGKPEVLFDRPDGRVVAVTPAGRLLIERQTLPDTAVVTLQWLREVRQKLPAPISAPR